MTEQKSDPCPWCGRNINPRITTAMHGLYHWHIPCFVEYNNTIAVKHWKTLHMQRWIKANIG